METTTDEICCRLCFCSNGNFLNIFNDAPSVFDIAELLKRYFQDEVKLSDPLPNIICSDCWRTMESFHEFHEKVLSEREKYLNLHFDVMAIKTEADSILVTKRTNSPIDELEVNNMCIDPAMDIDNKNDLHDGHETFPNISTDCGNEISVPDGNESMLYENFIIKEESEFEYEPFSCTESNNFEKEWNGDSSNGSLSDNQKVDIGKNELSHFFDMKCDKCENVFESLEKALIHYNQMHNDQNGYIKCCNRQFNDITSVRDHTNWHLNPDIFKCTDCNERMSNRKDLKSHINAFHLSSKFICDVCGAGFKAKKRVKEHLIRVHVRAKLSVQCGLCDKRLKFFKCLHKHLESAHSVDLKNIVKDTKNIPLLDLNDDRMKAAMKKFVDQTCDICHVKLDTLAIARNHYLIEHKEPEGYYKCCKRKICTESPLIDHLNWHVNPNTFRCRLCCRAYYSRTPFRDHINSHVVMHARTFACDKCSDVFPRPAHYRQHMKNKHNITISKPNLAQVETISNRLDNDGDSLDDENFDFRLCDMTCDIHGCTTVFASLSNAKEHYVNVHLNRNGYIKCSDTNCGDLKLRTPYDVKDHMAWHKDPECFKCEVCGSCSKTKRLLSLHVRIHSKKYKCEQCDKEFVRKHDLTEHMLWHEDPKKIILSCPSCGKICNNIASLRAHRHRFHSTNKKNFICEICAVGFPQQGLLRKHLKTVHKQGSEKPKKKFKCEICSKVYCSQGSVYTHRLTHQTGQFKCDLCGHISKHQAALSAHKRVVHTKEKFKCHICEKLFKFAPALKDHIAIHSNDKQWKCEFCEDVSFIWRTDWYKHRKRVHPVEWEAEKAKKEAQRNML